MALRSNHLWAWLICAFLSTGAPNVGFAQSDGCAAPRAIIAGETALRDALSRNDGNAAPLLGALSRLAKQAADVPEVAAYLASRHELAAALANGDELAARQLIRQSPHRTAGQQALVATRANDGCLAGLSPGSDGSATAQGENGQITGGHGTVATENAASATGSQQTNRPGGPGLETSPLSFLRGFDVTWHVLPAVGATLAFSALMFGLTRDRRKYRRFLCHLPVEILDAEYAVTSTLLDISRGGAKLVRSEPWSDGKRLKIRLERDAPPKAVRVMWVNDGFMGVLFRKPLSAPEFQHLLASARAGAGAAARDAS